MIGIKLIQKIKSILAFVIIVLAAFNIISCRSEPHLGEVEYSLPQIRKAIVREIGKPRVISKDGKDLASSYYDSRGGEIAEPDRVRYRYHTLASIRGDRRPYSLFVDVLKEQRQKNGKYIVVDKDLKKAKVLLDKINKALYESREDGNVIDDLRPY